MVVNSIIQFTAGLGLSLERRFWPTMARCPDILVQGLFQVFLLFALMLSCVVDPGKSPLGAVTPREK